MGVDFYIACEECLEFISLHKWSVIESAGKFLVDRYPENEKQTEDDSAYEVLEPESNYRKIRIDNAELAAAAADADYEADYIMKLKPVVIEFAENHRDHNLFLLCDMWLLPWSFADPEFDIWLEVPGACSAYQTLPRNMIEIEGIKSWEEAEEKMQDHWPFDYDVEDELQILKAAFEKRLADPNREG